MKTLMAILALSLLVGCGKAPDLSEPLTLIPQDQPTAQPQTVAAQPTPTATPSPVASASPSPSPTPTPTVVAYLSTAWNLLCPAFNSWNQATTTIQVNYTGYFYTFAQSGVTFTMNGTTSTVGQATLLYGTNPTPTTYACKVTVQSGQIVSIQ